MRQSRVGAALLLGAAALLLVPAVASAQFRFGMGGYRGGYYGYSPGFSYGYAPGLYNYGYSPYSSGYYPGYTTYGGWSNPGYAWGNYNWGVTSYPSSATSDFYYNAPGMSSYYGAGSAGDMGPSYSYGSRSGAGTRDAAILNVRVPDGDAEVWVDGKLTRQRGTSREYESPPLTPDKSYSYEVRARWTENGKAREQTKTVPVKANGVATVDFTTAANNSRVDEIDRGRDRRGSDVDRDRRAPDSNRTNPGDKNLPSETNPKPGGTRPPDTRSPDKP